MDLTELWFDACAWHDDHDDRKTWAALVERSGASGWMDQAVPTSGIACRGEPAGPGEREVAIRSPLEALLNAALAIDGAVAGRVEVEAPGRGTDPERFTGRYRRPGTAPSR